MTVTECDVPRTSALDRDAVEAATFRDSYRSPLANRDLGIVDIFRALFGHAPGYVKALLIARNAAAKLAGLEVATNAEILKFEVRDVCKVGDKIGPWPIFAISDSEIIAGRNNKHMDFRLSVLKETNAAGASVVVSTICSVHNAFGRAYLFLIVPFHRQGVQDLIASAIAAKRL